jgi:hypothetical protein
MRTAIFLGLTSVADAIRKDWLGQDIVGFAACLVILFLCMDISEFIKKITK